MKTLLLTLIALGTTTAAHAAVSPVAGSCHVNIFDANGTIVRQSDTALTPVDPLNHFGLGLAGDIEGYRVQVQLAVGRYDHIGEGKNDQIFLELSRDSVTSSHFISGRAIKAGDELNGDLIVPSSEIDCSVKLAN